MAAWQVITIIRLIEECAMYGMKFGTLNVISKAWQLLWAVAVVRAFCRLPDLLILINVVYIL